MRLVGVLYGLRKRLSTFAPSRAYYCRTWATGLDLHEEGVHSDAST
jgi:hypothetical protein